MNSKKLETLKKLLRQKEHEQQRFARHIFLLQQKLQNLQAQANQLSEYEKEYQAQWNQYGHQGVNALDIQNYYSFLQRVEHLTHQQRQQIFKQENNIDHERQKVMVLHQKSEALKKTIDKIAQLIELEELKREQILLDEVSQNIFIRKQQDLK